MGVKGTRKWVNRMWVRVHLPVIVSCGLLASGKKGGTLAVRLSILDVEGDG